MVKKIISIAIVFFVIACVFGCGCVQTEEKRYVVDYKIVDDEVGDETLITKEYQFTYDNKDWHIVASVPKYRYDAYINEKYLLVKKQKPSVYDSYYDKHEPEYQRAFIIDDYVMNVVDQFKTQNGALTNEQLVGVITHFVQTQIKYTDDKVQYGKEYVAYPMQTLINGKGDCDCVAVLLSALLNHAGYNSVTVYINYYQEGHVFVGIEHSQITLPYGAISIQSNGKAYYVIDSTAILPVGQLSSVYVDSANSFYRVYDKGYEYGYQNGELCTKRDVLTGSMLLNNYKED